MDRFAVYNIAAAALLILTAVPSVIIFLCSLCLARRRNDPARTWLNFFKAAFAFFCLGIVLIFFNYLLDVLYRLLYDSVSSSNIDVFVRNIQRAQTQTGVLGSLFDELSVICILLALLSLGKAARFIHAGKLTSADRFVQWGGYGVAGLLAILELVSFALSEKLYTTQYQGAVVTTLRDNYKLVRDFRRVTFALLVIQMIFNVFVLVRSIVVAVKTRAEPRVTTATRYLIVCCVLLLLKTCYNVGYYADYVPLGDTVFPDIVKTPGPYFAILDVIFNFWPSFIILMILFALGTKKQHGVWATEQPFMMVRPMAHATGSQPLPWGYEYSPTPLQPAPQTWQQPTATATMPPVYGNPQELPPQHAAGLHAPQFRHELSPQQHWSEPVSPHIQRSYESSVQTGAVSPPPPSHYEAMGLNHQADGTPPQVVPIPYNEKR
ncbi:hypothetical protein JDV02_008628 [Purpureocillium takamizusanense]|uniref:Uncharacterized protein n=1 Tax=Purpureocillium takamizusanense TaxID=2060973 RepID=A0A9Q8QMG6_9HYPO|nr:uncharacterized protein JDV02_008628 [Purpureocillium takamizusanense]UNI22768.1 hypothetical protein JDV02_008628 [Purpureocillium takamizusanense]